MRRFWLTLLTAFALAMSGVASAMGAEACPMQQAAAAQAAHDCCPDQGEDQKDVPQQQQHDTDGCLMGMACRAAPAVATTFAPIALPEATILISAPLAQEPANLSVLLQQLFRPPRSI